MAPPFHQTSVRGCHNEALCRLGQDHVFQEQCLKLPDLGMPRPTAMPAVARSSRTSSFRRGSVPDESKHEVAYDPDNPILFVLEVLSKSSFRYDLEPKVEIYRVMGIREYFLYDPEL